MKYKPCITFALLSTIIFVSAHEKHDSSEIPQDYLVYPYQTVYPGDNTVTADSVFSGITTFARLPWVQCLGKDKTEAFDIAFIGAPFDTGTSYRPGARFGPSGIRAGSRRLTLCGGYNVPLTVNPFMSGMKIVDCGDIPITPYDKMHAIKQIEDAHKELLHRIPFSVLEDDSITRTPLSPISMDGKHHPRIITLGGDHTIVLPVLRSIYSAYGEISVIHFGSHLNTWEPSVLGGAPSQHHTSLFWASQEGLIKNGSSIHGGIRTRLFGPSDYEHDDTLGFRRIEAREIDTIGTDGIIKKIRETVGNGPVYLSIGIDSIDPAFAPAAGTPETGGWSTRELRTILRGLKGVHIVSADIVEVAPAYDTAAETTTLAAADVLFEVLSIMAMTPHGIATFATEIYSQLGS